MRHLVLAMAMLLAGAAAARADGLVHDRLTRSAGMVFDVRHVCPVPYWHEGIGGHVLTQDERYLPEQFGAANQFGQTRHGFSTSRTSEGNVALIVSNMRQPGNASCGAIIVFNSQGAKVAFRPRFNDRKPPEARVSAEVRDAIRALARQCETMDEPEFHFGGAVNDLVVGADGVVVTLPDLFLCDAAVGLSLSALDVRMNGQRIRISFVLDQIFLGEE